MEKSSNLTETTSLGYPITLFQPAETQAQQVSEIKLIIICSWMGASPRHVTKYIQGYQQRFPTATILLIESSLEDVIWKSNSFQQQRLHPALILLRSFAEKSAKPSIILHLFSNGGAQSFGQLASAYRAEVGDALPIRSMICDSCPGRASWKRSMDAMTLSLPQNPFLYYFGVAVVSAVMIYVFIGDNVIGSENVIEKARRQLLEQQFVNSDVPRVYLYSKADQMVGWQDVAEHAEMARRLGTGKVAEVVFEKSVHVSHVKEDQAKYWNGVMNSLK